MVSELAVVGRIAPVESDFALSQKSVLGRTIGKTPEYLTVAIVGSIATIHHQRHRGGALSGVAPLEFQTARIRDTATSA
jgi:hypothetical protein